jgi:hypothetical protein
MVTRYAGEALLRAGYPAGLAMPVQGEEVAAEVRA